MRTRLVGFLVLLALGGISPSSASATPDTFTFNVDFCTNPCLGGVAATNNGGTVTLTQAATNIVDVKVSLNSPLLFNVSGLDSFLFNINNNPTLTQITSGSLANDELLVTNLGGSTWTLHQPAGNGDGASNPNNFGYSLNCASAPGHCLGSPSVLEFQVDVLGLTVTDFETLPGSNGNTKVDFAANVANGSCGGMIGAGRGEIQSTAATTGTVGSTDCTTNGVPVPPSGSIPEPATLALVGFGLIGLSVARRRK